MQRRNLPSFDVDAHDVADPAAAAALACDKAKARAAGNLQYLSRVPCDLRQYYRRTLVAGPPAGLSGRAAKGGLILNENKRPGFVSAEQGVTCS
jgi:hypothetical protein